MFLPDQGRQVRRRGITGLIMALMAVAVSLLLCFIHGAVVNSQQTMEQIYLDIPVSCTVTNLTGTKTDQLDLNSWVADLFFGTLAQDQDQTFASYVTNVVAKMTFYAKPVLEDETMQMAVEPLVVITAREADKTLWAENGCSVYWYDGYDDSVFASDEAALLVPQDWLQSLTGEEEGTLPPDSVTLAVSGEGFSTVEQTFRIAGVYIGGSGSLYCGWTVGSAIPTQSNGYALVDSISATLRDNHTLDEFWDDCASYYFTTPDPLGKLVPRETSFYGSNYYTYALDINDTVLRQTVSDLQRNQTLLNLLGDVLLGLSLAGGFLIALLLVQGRQRELALNLVLGVSRAGLFLSVLMEQLLLALSGTLLGAACYALIARTAPAWGQLALAILVDGLGIAIAVAIVLHKDLIRTLGGEH